MGHGMTLSDRPRPRVAFLPRHHLPATLHFVRPRPTHLLSLDPGCDRRTELSNAVAVRARPGTASDKCEV